jgi:hypothetical protein
MTFGLEYVTSFYLEHTVIVLYVLVDAFDIKVIVSDKRISYEEFWEQTKSFFELFSVNNDYHLTVPTCDRPIVSCLSRMLFICRFTQLKFMNSIGIILGVKMFQLQLVAEPEKISRGG